MPARLVHLAKAESNEQLSIMLRNESRLDWAVTVLFYAALHLVEATLAPQMHSLNHSMRFAQVTNDPRLRPVFFHYRELYNVSLRSRYDCQVFTLSDVQNLYVAHYEPIKHHLRPLLGFTF